MARLFAAKATETHITTLDSCYEQKKYLRMQNTLDLEEDRLQQQKENRKATGSPNQDCWRLEKHHPIWLIWISVVTCSSQIFRFSGLEFAINSVNLQTQPALCQQFMLTHEKYVGVRNVFLANTELLDANWDIWQCIHHVHPFLATIYPSYNG